MAWTDAQVWTAVRAFAEHGRRATPPRTNAANTVAESKRARYSEQHMRASIWWREMSLVCIALATFVAGCANSKSTTRSGEESVTSTSSNLPRASAEPVGASAPSCGREVRRLDQGYDATARKCLWDAYQAGKPADLSLTHHTIEGDPVTFTLRVVSASSIEVIEDNQDRFGPRGVRRSTCKKLEQSASMEGRHGFVVSGCSGAAEKVEIR